MSLVPCTQPDKKKASADDISGPAGTQKVGVKQSPTVGESHQVFSVVLN